MYNEECIMYNEECVRHTTFTLFAYRFSCEFQQ